MKDGTFFSVPNVIVREYGDKMTTGALRVFLSIACAMNRKTGESFPSYTTIENEWNISRETIANGVKELLELGILTVTKRGQRNIYQYAHLTSSQYGDLTSQATVLVRSLDQLKGSKPVRSLDQPVRSLDQLPVRSPDANQRGINQRNIPSVEPNGSPYSGPFEKFFRDYGRKGSKAKAWAEWQRAIEAASFVAIIDAVPIYLKTRRVHDGYKVDAWKFLSERIYENPTLGEENDHPKSNGHVVTRGEQVLKNTIQAGDDFLKMVAAEEAKNGRAALQSGDGPARPRVRRGEQRRETVHLLSEAHGSKQ